MFSFTVNQLLQDRSGSDEDSIRHHCRYFAPYWGEQNLVVQFIDAIEFLPPETIVEVSGNNGSSTIPFLEFNVDVPGSLRLEASLEGYSQQNRPHLFIAGVKAERQAQGAMSGFMPGILNCAQKLGAEYASLSASKIGSYAWARFGFWPTYRADRVCMQERIWQLLTEEKLCNPAEAEVVKKTAQDLPEQPKSLRNLFLIQHLCAVTNQSFAKKLLLSEFGWSGRLNIRPGSKDLAYTLNYCRLAASRIRVA
jgi:hypothetical protein